MASCQPVAAGIIFYQMLTGSCEMIGSKTRLFVNNLFFLPKVMTVQDKFPKGLATPGCHRIIPQPYNMSH